MIQPSVIACIESGLLEQQTVLMFSTLRRFGGHLAQAPAVAFRGRKDAPLHPDTERMLADLDVEIVSAPALNPAPWFNYSNKIAAIRFAESHFDTDYCLWLDSDLFVAREPDFVTEDWRGDIKCRCEFTGPILTRDDDRFQAYWAAVCTRQGLSVDHLPYCTLDRPFREMKPYFNSGVVLWKRGIGLAQSYYDCFSDLLGSRLSPEGIGPWFADQVALTMAVYRDKLDWGMLGISDNLMLFKHFLENPDIVDALPDAAVIHYSKSRRQPHRPEFDRLVSAAHPDTFQYVEELERNAAFPQPGPAPVRHSLRAKLRKLRQQTFVRTVRNL